MANLDTRSTSMKAQLAIRDIAHNTSEALNDHHRSVEEQLQRILSAVQSVPRVNASKGMAIKQQTTSEDIVSFNAFTFEPGCTMSCCCPCHKSFRYGLMGKLFLGYTGSFFGPIACKESFCRKSATSFKANISYYFPRWFMMRALEFQVRLSRLGEPTMSLTFRAVLPRTSKPFIAAAQGDVNQLYSMLGSRIIHPDIIESSFGRSLLEVKYYSIVICKVNSSLSSTRYCMNKRSSTKYC